ncbi:hypothetical protein [Deinococcus cellulosilyticus]|uniref:hypothetical protein n=1 Tax=Deinococcus cellulosilyticus TaxID=401558 RepID=UPI0011BEBCB9|nr:hypothetical protein [Deinococcus cellulosilyticus]
MGNPCVLLKWSIFPVLPIEMVVVLCSFTIGGTETMGKQGLVFGVLQNIGDAVQELTVKKNRIVLGQNPNPWCPAAHFHQPDIMWASHA